MSQLQNQSAPQSSPPVLEKKDGLAPHARSGLSEIKWKGSMAAFCLIALICGYDVSNVANIQPRLYEDFGNIELLPWIGLSYSLANFAFLSFARKISYAFDMKWVYIAHLLIFFTGATVAGASKNITSLIIGRVVMGWGGSVVQQTNLSYVACFATDAESPKFVAMISASWAAGLVIGGPIGSAFAENDSATWRWAFYLNLPLIGICLLLSIFCLPSHFLGLRRISLWKRLAVIDPLGISFNLVAPILFAIAYTFSGPIWAWSSGESISVWIVFGIVFISWIMQQHLCIFTTAEERAFPMHMLQRFDLLPLWIASGCAGAAYAVTLYYIPLFFAFSRGYESLEQTARLLPFVLVFIIVVLFTGAMLPKIGRYKIVYILAGTFTLAGSAAMVATLEPGISDSKVMGFEALLGTGLGMHFQHALGISNVLNNNPRDRVDSNVICNMIQMGGIAVSLTIAGCIFQNSGYNLLVEAVSAGPGTGKYSEQDLREALAGVSSVVWQSKDSDLILQGVQAVTEVISREFYIVVVSAALCLVCGACMRWERPDYNQKRRTSPAPRTDSAC